MPGGAAGRVDPHELGAVGREVGAERVVRRHARAQLVLLGERQLGDAVEADGVGFVQLVAVERRALAKVGELLAEGGVVEGELLLPRARLDLWLEHRGRLAPDLLGRLDDEAELRPLLGDRQLVPLDGRGEAALR